MGFCSGKKCLEDEAVFAVGMAELYDESGVLRELGVPLQELRIGLRTVRNSMDGGKETK